jgi:outer membrane protein TolC
MNALRPLKKSREKPQSFLPKRVPWSFLTKKKTVVTATLFFLAGVQFESYSQKVSLGEILDQSKQNYPLLKAKQAEINSAERRVKSAKTEFLPNLILQHQYTFSSNNNVVGAFFPNEGSALSPSGGIRPENIYQGAFGSFTTAMVDWRVFTFGRVAANVKASAAELALSQADYENELFQNQVKVVDAYLILLINQQLVRAQQHNLERAETFKRVVDAAVMAGLRAGVDSSLASAEYAKAKLLLLESQRAERSQRYRLTELTGTLREDIQVDSMQFYSKLPVNASASGDNFLRNPALRFSQSQIDLSQARSLAIKKAALPSISLLAAGWGRGSGVSNKDESYSSDFATGVNYQVYNYLFGVSTRWNLTHILRFRNDYKSERFQMDRFRHLYDQEKLSIDRHLRDAEMKFEVALQQAKLTPVQLAAARSAFEQAEARYESGLTDLFTLAQSVATLNRAEVDRYVANGNAWRALLLKAASVGDLSLFLDQLN